MPRRRRARPPGRGTAAGSPGAAGPRRRARAAGGRRSAPSSKANLPLMGPAPLRVACVQMTSGPDKAANIERAELLVADAAAAGADLVVLPEKWNAIGPPDVLHAAGEPLEGGESVEAMSGWAAR